VLCRVIAKRSDMGQSMGKAVETLFHQQFVVQLVSECANNAQNPQAQQLAAWTQKVIMDLQAN
jgi:predicted metal-dependent HD superfamily phosphohydrolase